MSSGLCSAQLRESPLHRQPAWQGEATRESQSQSGKDTSKVSAHRGAVYAESRWWERNQQVVVIRPYHPWSRLTLGFGVSKSSIMELYRRFLLTKMSAYIIHYNERNDNLHLQLCDVRLPATKPDLVTTIILYASVSSSER